MQKLVAGATSNSVPHHVSIQVLRVKVTQVKVRITVWVACIFIKIWIQWQSMFSLTDFWQMGTHHTVISSLFSKQAWKWSKDILVRWAHLLVRAVGIWGEAELALEWCCLGASPWVVLGTIYNTKEPHSPSGWYEERRNEVYYDLGFI